MALHLNLLHEEILEQRQRQRDPLKIGVLVLIGCGTMLFLYYLWTAYRTLEIKSRLGNVQREWAKIEPKVTAAQKHAAELTNMVTATRVLDNYIDKRFFWAPVLEKISHCVGPNVQLTAFDGQIQEDERTVSLMIEGVAAAREPRSAAEDLRQMLREQLEKNYHDVKVEFKTLEDAETFANLGGVRTPMARYSISATFKTTEEPKPTPAPAKVKHKTESE
ncbi:MAG TPA: hypothetical protein VEI58_08585 [Chthoniobacterales bacterium]|nr:hypothetical protein [Chthoniobacterales bacterium]